MENALTWIRRLLAWSGPWKRRSQAKPSPTHADLQSSAEAPSASRWDQELRDHLGEVFPPEHLAQRVLGQMTHQLKTTPSRAWRNRESWRWRWSAAAALAVAVVFVVAGLWLHLRPSPDQLLAQKLWQVFCQRYEAPDQVWFTRTSPPREDEVPGVVRACSRLRWKKLKLDHLTAVVHELVNHEQASRRAWLFVVHRAEVALPSRPPRSPQWQAGELVAGCWADPDRGRTYVLVVPGGVQAYRFWITPRRVA